MAANDCEGLRREIEALQAEFERLWVAVSSGTGSTARYRELRDSLQDLRARYAAECGALTESTGLPPSIVSTPRAG